MTWMRVGLLMGAVIVVACGNTSSERAGGLELGAGITTTYCPGAAEVTVPEGRAISYCVRLFNRTDDDLSEIVVEYGRERHVIDRLEARRGTVVKLAATASTAARTTLIARGRRASGALTASNSVTLALHTIAPFPSVTAPPAPPPPGSPAAPPLVFQPSMTGQPHRVEAPRTCGARPCACAGKDSIKLFPKDGEAFPDRETAFPGIRRGVNVSCDPLAPSSVVWGQTMIELPIAPDRGGLAWIGIRSGTGALHAGNCAPLAPLPRTMLLPPGSGFQPRLIPPTGCIPQCSALCVPDGAGGCLNEVTVTDVPAVKELLAANGTAVPGAPRQQKIPANQPIQLRWKIDAPDLPITALRLFRDGTEITPAPLATATQLVVPGTTVAVTFALEATNECGVSFRRELRLAPEVGFATDVETVALAPGRTGTLQVRLLQDHAPVDVKVSVEPEAVPAGSDLFPKIYIDRTSLTLPASASASVPLVLTMEDSNTGIADGTRVAWIVLEPTTVAMPWVWIPVTYRRPPATGFAELHAHPYNEVAFGAEGPYGGAIVGSASAPLDQLGSCLGVHGELGIEDPYGFFFGGGAGHPNDGFPSFRGWPSWFSGTHQQMHEDWIHRAQQGGMRLMVALASDNRLSCAIHMAGIRTSELIAAGVYSFLDVFAFLDPVTLIVRLLPLDPRNWLLWDLLRRLDEAFAYCTPHRQMQTIDRQIEMAHAFAARNSAWAEIALSGADAQRIIEQGKLAVVLGVEMSELFECLEDEACTATSVEAAIDAYHARGVRYVFPLHRSDNAFGGAATLALVSVEKKDACPDFGTCNPRGLTALGRTLIERLMARGMLIDVDHMSAVTKQDTFDLIRTKGGYPVFSGHAALLDLTLDGRHDGLRTRTDLGFIRENGGMVAPIMDPSSDAANFKYPAQSCPHSTRTYRVELDYVFEAMRGRSIGIGTDFNGFGGLPGPRTGPFACHHGKGADLGPPPPGTTTGAVGTESDYYPVALPIQEPPGASPAALLKSRIGDREYDIRTDGVAHVGMLPDMMKEVMLDDADGLGDEMASVLRSADAFARAWRRAECRGAQLGGAPPPHGECPR